MVVIEITKYDTRYELLNKELLCSEIIRAMLTNDDIIIRTYEGNSFEENGLFNLLDILCEYWNFDKTKIVIETNNWLEKHSVYAVRKATYNSDFVHFTTHKDPIPWNGNKVFGMFIGLARRERIYSLLRYRRSPYKEMGLTSFSQDFMDIDTNVDLAKVSQYADCKINDITSIRPYSDIDSIRKPPIWLNLNTVGPLWHTVYEQIAIEIVCETGVHPDSFLITEKTLRPIYYRRPFLIIGAKNYLKKLRSIGFKTFEDIIPDYYDKWDEFTRVDDVFQILEDILDNNSMAAILDKCQPDIEHNYNLLLKMSKEQSQLMNDNPGYFAHDKK